ncbi:MAG: DNA-3-methyladenine glycosylase [Candidatus Margulisiibacteriota bacterium]
MNILPRGFYNRPTITVARELLGKTLVYQVSPDNRFTAKIIETEAYLDDDPASHAFRGKTPRNAPMFGPPGFTYIYFIYGMYHCLNFVTEKEGKAGAVLIRALEPLEGIEQMQKNRARGNKNVDMHNLSNGPGKLCRALGLTKAHNEMDMCLEEGAKGNAESKSKIQNSKSKKCILRNSGTPKLTTDNYQLTTDPKLYLLDAPKLPPEEIAVTTRIGIREEHQQHWRFYINGNRFVSKL